MTDYRFSQETNDDENPGAVRCVLHRIWRGGHITADHGTLRNFSLAGRVAGGGFRDNDCFAGATVGAVGLTV